VTVPWADLATVVPALLEHIQESMLASARATLNKRIVRANDWPAFLGALAKRSLALSPWCGVASCEDDIKRRSGEESAGMADGATSAEDGAPDEGGEQLTGAAKSLCIPFEQPPLPEGSVCVLCRNKAVNLTLFGRSY
jgi:prolyl-tRNA synthetase